MGNDRRQRRKSSKRRRRQLRRKDRSIRFEGLEPRMLLAANFGWGGDFIGPIQSTVHDRFAEVDQGNTQQTENSLRRGSSEFAESSLSEVSYRLNDSLSNRQGKSSFHSPSRSGKGPRRVNEDLPVQQPAERHHLSPQKSAGAIQQKKHGQAEIDIPGSDGFAPDDGIRFEDATIPRAGINPEDGSVVLYYSVGPDEYVTTSQDGGLNFSEGHRVSNRYLDPRNVELPAKTESGETIWRRYSWDRNEGVFKSEKSMDGIHFTPEDGVRYDPPSTDNIGVYTNFVTADGRVGLMYIGDKGTTEANIRLAFSDDNGENFQLADDNPLGDAGTHDTGMNQRDPYAIVLEDGTIRVFTMVQGGSQAPLPGQRSVGTIYSFTSTDHGETFVQDEGIRLQPEDFDQLHVWSLNDPSVIQLPDGQFRMYVAAMVSETADGAGAEWVIVSATTSFESSIDQGKPEEIIGDKLDPDRGDSSGVVSESGVRIEHLSDGSIVCYPESDGPLPAILYNHGGKGTAVGGDLEGTCLALAEEDYVVRAEQRPASLSLDGQLDDVLSGLDALFADPLVDTDQIGIMGFSRGGLLSLQAAIERPDDIDSVLLMAPAHGRNQLAETLEDVSALSAPVQIYVAENDTYQADHVQLAQEIVDVLMEADKEVDLTIFPDFADDGHELFFEVREPYWSDAVDFFNETLVNVENEQSTESSLQLVHLSTDEFEVGTHRPEIHLTPSGEIMVLVVQPGEDPQSAGRWKHQGYRFSETMQQLADPFMISQVTDEFGEPADHRAIVVEDQLVVVYQSNVFGEDTGSCVDGPAEDCVETQSLMLARFTLEGEELFRGPIVANVPAEEFSLDSFPDHCLWWDDGTLIVSTGSQGNGSITFREVDIEDGSVRETYRVDTDPAGIPSAIGNSLIRTDTGLYLFSYILGGTQGHSALVISQLGDDYQPTQVATFSADGEEWSFPTSVIQYGDYLMVGYLSRDANGSRDIETNPFQPRLLILDRAFNEVDNIQISNEDGFAHVHPTLVIEDNTLHYAWSKRTSRGPQVQVEQYELSFLENDPSEHNVSGQVSGPESPATGKKDLPVEELPPKLSGMPPVDSELVPEKQQPVDRPGQSQPPARERHQRQDRDSRSGPQGSHRVTTGHSRDEHSGKRANGVKRMPPDWEMILSSIASQRSKGRLRR